MKKALSLATLSFFVLGLAACNDNNDVTGINAGKTASASAPTLTLAASEAGPEAQAKVIALADRPHKVAQPDPSPFNPQKRPTPIRTP